MKKEVHKWHLKESLQVEIRIENLGPFSFVKLDRKSCNLKTTYIVLNGYIKNFIGF